MGQEMESKPLRRDLLRAMAVGGTLLAAALVGVRLDGSMREEQTEMAHVVLLGDSILDNGAYVARGQATIDHLHRLMPSDWRATLLAVDGSITTDVERQLAHLPADATHLVLSVGGNDALRHMDILQERAVSAAGVLGRLADIQDEFAARYDAMLRAVLGRGLPTAVCTIYNANFPDPTLQRLATTAAAVFNDVILRAAFAAGLPVIDLRLMFDEEADYANAIEPSAQGGAKIARTIVGLVQEHDFAAGRSAIFV